MITKQSAITKTLSKEDLILELSSVVSILNNNAVHSVKILFGFAWGNEYCNWTPFEVKTNGIEAEILKAEQLGVGKFGNDDFYVLQDEIEILFCHEHDIHLSSNNPNVIVSTIIERWQKKNILQSKNML